MELIGNHLQIPGTLLLILGAASDRDAAAQRRLDEIAESLCDFQLRTVGTSVILFSCGGVEAKGEAFADILAAAGERMRETRRRSLSLEAPQRRKAV